MKQQAISVGAVAVGVALTAALSAAVAQEVSGQKGGGCGRRTEGSVGVAGATQ